jgi:hypothetical protein
LKRQKCVVLSTAKTKYVAAAETTIKIIWLKILINQILPFNNAIEIITLLKNNEKCIKIAKNPENYSKVKHNDIRHHFLKD